MRMDARAATLSAGLALLGATAGCAHKTIAPSQGALTVMGLAGTEWRVEDIGEHKVSHKTATALRFGSDGQVSGTTGCNHFTGTATIDAARINFSPFATTRKACAPELMSQEQSMLDALSAVRGYSTDAKQGLRLLGGNGQTLMRLSRAAP